MKSVYHINKNRVLPKAQDYEFLRTQGLKYIENLSHKLWTDYNAHDPGITILEVLCYAITELGYRTSFKIEDLLTRENGDIQNNTFFPAKEIMTNAPLTELDYRKLLIDVEGINNAWIIYSEGPEDRFGYFEPLKNEIPVYINKQEDKLSLSSKDQYGKELKRLPLRGLNKIVVELSEDIDIGQLNRVSVEEFWLEEDRFVEAEITADFLDWDHPKASLLDEMTDPENVEIQEVYVRESLVHIVVQKKEDSAALMFKIRSVDPYETELVKERFNDPGRICGAIDKLIFKRNKVGKIYSEVKKVIYENRNFTEDWLSIQTITDVEIGICADVDLKNGADAEEVLAKIQEAIDQILNPPIRFYTLNEMVQKEYLPEQIFRGPVLSHGFLIDEEVLQAQLPQRVYASDIIASLMDIPGIKAIHNLLLTAYGRDGNVIEDAKNKSWILPLNGQQRPIFSLQRSKLLLFRDGIPFLIPERGAMEVKEGIRYLKIENNNFKLKNINQDFAFPTGTFFRLDDYYSIQNDFPATYGIGKGQISHTATPLRKAQAKQLKAYLQHFDQLLADFFKQLSHAKDLLDINQVDRTYFPQYLNDISGVEEDLFHQEVFNASYKKDLMQGKKDDDRSLYENDKLYYDRRNRFLDHLLARFNESFNEYVFMMYKVQENGNGASGTAIQGDELIRDKQNFLNRYPQSSYARSVSLNYFQEAAPLSQSSWKIRQRGGYEKRIATLLGINNILLSEIFDFEPKETWQYNTELGILSFSLQNIALLNLEEKWELAQELINNPESCKVFTFTKSYIYFVTKDGKKLVKLNKPFDTASEAERFIPLLYQAVFSHLENFYCVEHILLRPLTEEDMVDEDLLSVCLKTDCFSVANEDPYSFKATVILPGWLGRFRNRYFRTYAEKVIRREAPAHTLIKICWIGREDMVAFQKAYKDWIEGYRDFWPDYRNRSPNEKKTYNQKLSSLIKQLKRLNTIYDKGNLYDCKESESNNPIVLNNSSLGTL